MEASTPRQELLKSLWQSFSPQDKSYLLHLHYSTDDTSAATASDSIPDPALSSSNPERRVVSSTSLTHNNQTNSFATGYTRSRLNDLTRQFTNGSAESDGSKLTKEEATKREHERVLGFRMSRISKIKKFNTIPQKRVARPSSSRSILHSKISDNDLKMNKTRQRRSSTNRRLSVHKKPGVALNNKPIDQVDPQMQSTKTIMTMDEQDESDLITTHVRAKQYYSEIRFAAGSSFDHEGDVNIYKIRLRASDKGSEQSGAITTFDVEDVIVRLRDRNEAPSFTPFDLSVPEISARRTLVGWPLLKGASDPDIYAVQELQFKIIGGNEDNIFGISLCEGQVKIETHLLESAI